MPTTGSAFLAAHARSSLTRWEAAVVDLARSDPESLLVWPFSRLPLTDGTTTVVLQVMTDVLAIGTPADHLRIPLTPIAAQSVSNLMGWLLPTPWIVYQTWRAASVRLQPIRMVNDSVTLAKFARHSMLIDEQLRGAEAGIRSGQKKDVHVGNLHRPGCVLICGWYQPDGPDVFDDGEDMSAPHRQPIQPPSNVHSDVYVDYSHGIRPCASVCEVDGAAALLEDVYRDPNLSRLVSNEGPLRLPCYPCPVPPRAPRPVSSETWPAAVDVVTPVVPGRITIAANEAWRRR